MNELDDYASKLPGIYRDVLSTFPQVDPQRKMGFGLALQTIMVALDEKYSLGDIQIACAQLAGHDIVEIRNGIFVHPTDLGEKIISRLTGRPFPILKIPPLPPPPVPA
jgi:hypothetical protein